MTDFERDFKGVWIAKDVWLDTRLNALEKIILTEIDSLDNGERGCWASNEYLAEFCQCSESKVSKAISKLIDLDYIYLRSFDGRRRELKSRLSNFTKQSSKKYEAATEILPANNIDNNTLNKKKESKKEPKATDSFDKIIQAYTTDPVIIDLLQEWLKVRKAKRAAMTDRAISMNIEKLDKLAEESKLSVADYLKEIICRGWAAFYLIRDYQNTNRKDNTGYDRKFEPTEIDGHVI